VQDDDAKQFLGYVKGLSDGHPQAATLAASGFLYEWLVGQSSKVQRVQNIYRELFFRQSKNH